MKTWEQHVNFCQKNFNSAFSLTKMQRFFNRHTLTWKTYSGVPGEGVLEQAGDFTEKPRRKYPSWDKAVKGQGLNVVNTELSGILCVNVTKNRKRCIFAHLTVELQTRSIFLCSRNYSFCSPCFASRAACGLFRPNAHPSRYGSRTAPC